MQTPTCTCIYQDIDQCGSLSEKRIPPDTKNPKQREMGEKFLLLRVLA